MKLLAEQNMRCKPIDESLQIIIKGGLEASQARRSPRRVTVLNRVIRDRLSEGYSGKDLI